MSNKKRVKVKKVVQHSYAGGVGELLAKMKSFGDSWTKQMDELVEKHNILNDNIQLVSRTVDQLVTELSDTFQGYNFNQNIFAAGLESVDTKIGALLKLVGWLHFELVGLSPEHTDLKEKGQEAVREFSDKEVAHALKMALQQVIQERVAERKRRDEEEAIKREQAQKELEQSLAEKELANDTKELKEELYAPTGGQGSAIPEGAEVFGG